MNLTTDKLKEELHRVESAQDFFSSELPKILERVGPGPGRLLPFLGYRPVGTEAVVFSFIKDWSGEIPEVWIAREGGRWRVVHSDVPELDGMMAEDAIVYLLDRINDAVVGD
jgi:hypothetical protein